MKDFLKEKEEKEKIEKLKLEEEFERANNFTLASLMLLQQNLFNRGLGLLSRRHKNLLERLKTENNIKESNS